MNLVNFVDVVAILFIAVILLMAVTVTTTQEHDTPSSPSIHRRTRHIWGKRRFIVHVKNEDGKHDVNHLTGQGAQEVLDGYLSVDLNEQDLTILSHDVNIWSIEEDSEWAELGFRDEHLPENEDSAGRRLSEQIGYGVVEVQADQLDVGKWPVTVCVIDSGMAVSHPDLNRDMSWGVDRTSMVDNSLMPWRNDTQGHGTHVSGILAARVGNHFGVRGVGNLPLFIARALNDQGVAYQSDIMGAMIDCKNSGAKIISISLGGPYMTQSMRNLLALLFDDGILVVSAVGNDGRMVATYPGAHRDVVAVSALMPNYELWEASNYGPWLELAAPGFRIYSTYPPDGYASYTGTSMAAPFVSGVAALVWSHFPECEHSQIRYALAKSALDLGSEGCDSRFGYGVVQARAAFDFLTENSCQNSTWGRTRVSGMCSTLVGPTEEPSKTPSRSPSIEPDESSQSIISSSFPSEVPSCAPSVSVQPTEKSSATPSVSVAPSASLVPSEVPSESPSSENLRPTSLGISESPFQEITTVAPVRTSMRFPGRVPPDIHQNPVRCGRLGC